MTPLGELTVRWPGREDAEIEINDEFDEFDEFDETPLSPDPAAALNDDAHDENEPENDQS
jgi:hypothetical protein